MVLVGQVCMHRQTHALSGWAGYGSELTEAHMASVVRKPAKAAPTKYVRGRRNATTPRIDIDRRPMVPVHGCDSRRENLQLPRV